MNFFQRFKRVDELHDSRLSEYAIYATLGLISFGTSTVLLARRDLTGAITLIAVASLFLFEAARVGLNRRSHRAQRAAFRQLTRAARTQLGKARIVKLNSPEFYLFLDYFPFDRPIGRCIRICRIDHSASEWDPETLERLETLEWFFLVSADSLVMRRRGIRRLSLNEEDEVQIEDIKPMSLRVEDLREMPELFFLDVKQMEELAMQLASTPTYDPEVQSSL